MRLLSLLFFLIGLSFLFFILNTQQVYSFSLGNHEQKEQVYLSGTVAAEVYTGSFRYLTVNNVSVICRCNGKSLLSQEVQIFGVTEEYNGIFRIRALRILVS